jgi:hypothetical protein
MHPAGELPSALAAGSAPRVTVIIPTWNWSTVLPHSIASVLAQTFTAFELLVIGDGCTDDSAEVVGRITARDRRVRWINLPQNYGQQAWPNNEGLAQARGEFIAYLGHDDLWLPCHLEKLVGLLEAGADFASSIVADAQPDGSVLRIARAYVPGGWLPPTGFAHRRDQVRALGGWRDWRTLKIEPESDLCARLHASGARFADLNEVTAIKFSASKRKGVYKRRPDHEQRVWAARIQTEPELGTTLTAQIRALKNPHGTEPGWPAVEIVLRRFPIPWRRWIRRHVLRQTTEFVRERGETYPAFFAARRICKGAGASGRALAVKPTSPPEA